MDPTVWGPSYWFFLHTIAFNYPKNPTTIQKKIHYRLIHNLHEFIPSKSIANTFVKILEKYPVTPYLDTQKDFIKWMHFIHNKINEKLEKPKITLNEFYLKYYEEYKPKEIKFKEYYRWKEKLIYTLVVMGATGLIVYLYNK